MGALSKDVKVTFVQADIADGATEVDSSSVDMTGFEGVMFVGLISAQDASATAAIQAEGSADDTTFAAITGAVATSAVNSDDKMLIVDVYRPRDRYVRAALTRAGTTNTTWGGTLAIQYGASKRPTAHDASSLAAAAVAIVGV